MRGRARRPHDRSVHRSVPVLAAVLAVAGVLAGAGPSSAEEALAPGSTRTVVIQVPDRWAADADVVRVVVRGLEEAENECLEPEEEAGDDCLSERGELADKLVATVAWGAGDDACLPSVAAAQLPFADPDGVRFERVAGVQCVVLDLAFPHGNSDSLAQSDSLAFELDVVGEERPSALEPEGPPQAPTGPRDGSPDPPSRNPADPRSGNGPVPGARGAGSGGAGGATGEGAAAAQGAPGGAGAPGVRGAADPDQRTPPGPMVGRVGAQVSVGADGVLVETRAADTSLRGLALAWTSLLLGGIVLGWVAFVLLRRRRRTEVAA